ncbi:MAG: 30S ribosomal protein S6 [Acidobacteria bacterium]|nr:30S ribosomal protein S6 [Acidobacteriota bacterium]
MRTYEVAFIAAPNTADDDLSKLNSQIEHIVAERGGKITKVDNWGRRKLAYRIGKFDEGIYTFVYIEGVGQEIAEVERRLRVTDFVIRHLTVRTDEDLKRAAKLKAKRKGVVASRNIDDDFDLDLEDEDELMEEV